MSEMMQMSLSKEEWMLGIAYLLSAKSDCKSRRVGAIITDDTFHILGSGYNGTVTGTKHCDEEICARVARSINTNLHDDCMAVHAEMNALMQSKGKGTKLFSTTFPCAACLKTMLNFGIKEIYYCEDYFDNKNVRSHYSNIFIEKLINKENINIEYVKFLMKAKDA